MSHHLQNIGPVFALSVATLWLLQISVFSALITTFALAIIMQTGRALIAKSGLGDVGLGVGFVVGVGVFVFSGQALIIAGIPAYVAHWSVLAAMVAVAALISWQKTTADLTDDPSAGAEALFALSIALIVLSMRHPWVFPFAIPLAIFERYRHQTQHQVVPRLVTVTLIPVGWLAASVLRPDRWWYYYQYNDTSFFESVGWTISHWGVTTHPGDFGGSIAAYHWLSYALFGGLSHLGLLQPFDALAKFATPVLTFCFASLFVNQLRFAKSLFQFLIVLIGVMGISPAVFNSYSFSLLIAMGVFSLVQLSEHRGMTISVGALLALVSSTLVFSKTSAAVVVAVYLISKFIFGGKFLQFKSVPEIGIFLGSGALIFYLIFRNNAEASDWLYWEFETAGEIADNISSILGNQLIVLQFCVWFAVLYMAHHHQNLRNRVMFPNIFAAFLLLVITLSQVADEWEYFGFSVFPITTYFIVVSLFQNSISTVPSVFSKRGLLDLIALGITCLVIGFAYAPMSRRIGERFEITEIVGAHVWMVLLSSGPLLFILGASSIKLLIKRVVQPQFLVLSLVAVLLVSFGTSALGFRSVFLGGTARYTERVDGSGYPSLRAFGTFDLSAVGHFVRTETSPRVVIASNYFCCAGSEWWETQLASGRRNNFTSVYQIFNQWGGADYRLVAETRRQFLVQGNFHIGRFPNKRMIDAMTDSLAFANGPSAINVGSLRGKGIEAFIVYLPNTSVRDWSEYAVERFRSGDFVYLELR